MICFSRATASSILLCFLGVSIAHAHDAEVQLPFERPHAHESTVGHIHVGWESRYASEGRDSLDGDSLWTSSVEFGWQHLSGGIWYGNSPDQNYDELQISVALTESMGDFELYAEYTHLRFPPDGTEDNEIGAGVAWSGLPGKIEVAADAYHSFDAEGWFAEISATREFEITNRMNIGLSGIFAINQGYVPDGHDGANHLALRFGAEHEVTDALSISAHTAYSWALNRDPIFAGDSLLIDFFHGGVGLQWSF